MDNVLELKNVTKLYPGVVALDDVSLSFSRGEVHAIVGENGAGKSTLIKAIAGVMGPTAGQIIIEGTPYNELTTALSQSLGISVVYQEFSLVPVLTVAENVFMGNFVRRGWLVDKKEMERRTAELFEKLNINISPRARVADLTTGFQQLVEIAKAVSREPKVLIMDEPSAPLTTNEVESMFRMVRALKQQGVTIIYISHRLEEIFQVSDRVSVLRDGKYIATLQTSQTNKDELIQMMVGRTLKETFPERKRQLGEKILSVKGLCGNGVKDISFDLHKGEILGLGGLVGAGRTELVRLLFGDGKIRGGEIVFKGKPVKPESPQKAVKMGIALVCEDRKQHGVILGMSIKDNVTLTTIKELSDGLVVNKGKESDLADEYIKLLRIKTPGKNELVRKLSGGNQQKVILGKWLAAEPEILIMDEPTRGIDVGAKQEIYGIMEEMVEQGYAIIMISSEMEELLGMSDRLLIMSKGRMSGMVEKEDFSQEHVLKMFTGVLKNEE